MNTRRWGWLLAVFATGVALLAALIGWELRAGALPPGSAETMPPDQAVAERGAALARAGNCMACHTARGGAPLAGGRRIETPFGDLYASNLTPDAETGLGLWSGEAFRRAMQQGISRGGRLLYPAFPYAHFTRMSDADIEALRTYLRLVPAVRQPLVRHTVGSQTFYARHAKLQRVVAKDVGHGVVHAGLLPGKQVAAWGRVEPLVQIYNFRAHETAAATRLHRQLHLDAA